MVAGTIFVAGTVDGRASTITSTVTSTGTVVSTSTVTHTSTSTTTSTTTSTASQLFSSPLLFLDTNTTTIRYGGALTVTISIANNYPVNDTFIATLPTGSNISQWSKADFDACHSPTWSTFGFGVFRGHDNAGNISSAGGPLQLAAPIVVVCTGSSSGQVITLLPKSSYMVMTFNGPNGTVVSQRNLAAVNATTVVVCDAKSPGCASDGLFGYWKSSAPYYTNPADANTTSPYFSYFQPGEYTIVAEDMWGSTIYSYFQVVPVVTQ
jgi:hypothetical protein